MNFEIVTSTIPQFYKNVKSHFLHSINLQRVIKGSSIPGVTWGSTVYHMINYLNPSQTANAVLSALKGGLVDVLILDSNLAEALLKLSEDMPSQE